MALRSDSELNDDVNQGASTPAPPAPAKKTSAPPTPSRTRSGGSKAPKRKRRPSLNAIKHGVLSRSPVIGDEQEEDWIDLWDRTRETYDPLGHVEEIVVRQIALNHLQRAREERWMTNRLQLQFENVDHLSRDSTDPEQLGLPEDEVAWRNQDPASAMPIVFLIQRGYLDVEVPLEALVSYLTAFERAMGFPHPSVWPPAPQGIELPESPTVAVRELVKPIAEVAKKHGVREFQVCLRIVREIDQAHLHQWLRRSDDIRKRVIELNDAWVLNDADFAAHERRVNHLDKEYERLERRLETFQRARGGVLPPPLRLHRSES